MMSACACHHKRMRGRVWRSNRALVSRVSVLARNSLHPSRAAACKSITNSISADGLMPVPLPLRRETQHCKGASGASARSRFSWNDAIEGNTLKVAPAGGMVPQLRHAGKDFRHARDRSELGKVSEGWRPSLLQGIYWRMEILSGSASSLVTLLL